MTLQNRVDPFGRLHAVPERGTLMGNRGGCFHRSDKSLLPQHWRTNQWIICRLEFKQRRRVLMAPGRYTEVFFLDEATALAAGHRPCFECQRDRAETFRSALVTAGLFSSRPGVREMDAIISTEVQARLTGKTRVETVYPPDLPDGAIYHNDGNCFLKWQHSSHLWSFGGYGHPVSLHEKGHALTRAASLAAMTAGYVPDIHASAII